MNPERMIGSAGVRVAAVLLLLFSISAAILHSRGFVLGGAAVVPILAVGGGVLAVLGIIHSFQVTYSAWLAFSSLLHKVMVILLFGACYLLVVPFFFLASWPFDPLRLRYRSQDTFWVTRRGARADIDSLRRLG